MADSIQRIEHEFDPRRCLARIANGQCQAIRVEGANYCAMHGGGGVLRAQDQANLKAYRLAQWQSRVGEFAEHPNVKSLREEVAIARMVLESILVKCRSANDLLLFSSKINELLTQLKNLVTSCEKLESKMAYTLDKSAAINLAEQIVQIIASFVPEEQLDEIATKIGEAVVTAGRLTLHPEHYNGHS